ncbi:MAG: hypothetical protein Alpg2KO_29950 [Alphaproteobacteria bacterium]
MADQDQRSSGSPYPLRQVIVDYHGERLYEGWHFSLRAAVMAAYQADIELDRISLREADIEGIMLPGVHMRHGDLYQIKGKKAKLAGADLERADLRNADLRFANLAGANLAYADLTGADLTQANLERANLTGAKLENVKADFITLWNANLWGANLTGGKFEFADLKRAKMQGAIVKKAFARNAELMFSKLQGAEFDGTDLTNADLTEAEIDGETSIAEGWLEVAQGGDTVLFVEQPPIPEPVISNAREKFKALAESEIVKTPEPDSETGEVKRIELSTARPKVRSSRSGRKVKMSMPSSAKIAALQAAIEDVTVTRPKKPKRLRK